MTSHLDFVAAGWVIIVLGALARVSGLALLLASRQTSSRGLHVWRLLGGVGIVFNGIRLVRQVSWGDPPSLWGWVGLFLMAAAVAGGFSQRLRHKRTNH